MTPNQRVKNIAEDFAADLDGNLEVYKSAVIKMVAKEYYNLPPSLSGKERLNALITKIKNLKLSANITALLTGEIPAVLQDISGVWNEYFGEENVPPALYTSLLASSQVDFSAVNQTIYHTVKKEIQKAIALGQGFSLIQTNLNLSGLGWHQASTIANTYLSMFNTSYMAEVAKQAGLTYYLYDGIILKHSRQFCRERVNRVYTIDELKSMDNHQGLPVDQSLGGYNCTHFLSPLVNYSRKSYGEEYDPSHHY
ncbi:MAG: hypothetical protein AB9882_11945 [Ignavibacteriaceae bacterium]